MDQGQGQDKKSHFTSFWKACCKQRFILSETSLLGEKLTLDDAFFLFVREFKSI